MFKSKEFFNFYILIQAQIISIIGDRIFYIAILWYVYSKTNNTFTAGILLFFMTAPIVVFSLLSGVFVDRFNKKWILIVSDFIRFVSFFIVYLYFLYNYENIYFLFSLLFIAFSFSAFFETSYLSLYPILFKENLVKYNSLNQSISQIAYFVGPVLGGIIMAKYNIAVASLINALSFFLSAFIQLFLFYKEDIKTRFNIIFKDLFNNIKSDLREMFFFIKEKKDIYYLLNVLAILNLFGYPFFIFAAKLSKEILKSNVMTFSILESAFGVGIFFSGIVSLFYKNSKYFKITITSILLTSFTFLFLLFSKNSYYLITVVVFMGIFVGIANIYILTIFGNLFSDDNMGKGMSLVNLIISFTQPISLLSAGYILNKLPYWIYPLSTFIVFLFLSLILFIHFKDKKDF